VSLALTPQPVSRRGLLRAGLSAGTGRKKYRRLKAVPSRTMLGSSLVLPGPSAERYHWALLPSSRISVTHNNRRQLEGLSEYVTRANVNLFAVFPEKLAELHDTAAANRRAPKLVASPEVRATSQQPTFASMTRSDDRWKCSAMTSTPIRTRRDAGQQVYRVGDACALNTDRTR
jgi:hypothetical protein